MEMQEHMPQDTLFGDSRSAGRKLSWRKNIANTTEAEQVLWQRLRKPAGDVILDAARLLVLPLVSMHSAVDS
jgi:hypothetical protein